jgi:hypothetical protein
MMGTYAMTQAQKGCFVDLMTLQHQGIKITDAVMRKACGGIDSDIEVVRLKFEVDIDGTYFNKKMREVMMEREVFKLRQTERANKRWAKSMPPHMPNQMPDECTRVKDEDKDKELINPIEVLDARTFQSLDDLYES